MITQERVKELFDYEDGHLIWKEDRRANKIKGQRAGTTNKDRYVEIKIENKLYRAHRLIFLWHWGYLPDILDHIDGDFLNNKVGNLRECTKSENGCNSKTYSTNTSGVKGVHRRKDSGRWVATIGFEGKRYHGGYHDSIEDAEEAVKALREEHHGNFHRHN